MKTLKKNQSQLILCNKSNLAAWATWIFGCLFSALWLTLLFYRLFLLGSATTFTCQRMPEKTINCQLKKYQLPLSWEITKIPLGDLQSARLEKGSNNGGIHHRPVFVTRSSGEIPLKEFSSGQEYQQKIVDRVNKFINDDKQTSVTVRDIEDLPVVFQGFVFNIVWLVAGIQCLRSRQVKAKFDRTLNCFTLKQTNAFGTKLFEHSLSEIADIVLQEGTRNKHYYSMSYHIFIVMASDDRILLSHGTSFLNTNKQREFIANLREYLNIP